MRSKKTVERLIHRIAMAITWSLALLCTNCLDPYPLPDVSSGFLVVDARFTNDPEANRIILSFAGQVNEGGTPVSDARVSISDDLGNNGECRESATGEYVPVNENFVGEPGRKYVLDIQLIDGRRYQSDSSLFMAAPPIDELKWTLTEQPSDNNSGMLHGVDIRLSTHDPDNITKNYMWYYEEIWEVVIPFPVLEEYDGSGRTQGDFKRIDYTRDCYLRGSSYDIMMKTTSDQEESRIENLPIIFISSESSRLWRDYRIRVWQFALSDDAWKYHQQLNEITSQNGSVFDKQPYSLKGNIYNVNSSEEVVMGYFLTSAVSTETIEFSAWDLPDEYRGDFPLYWNCHLAADTFHVLNRTNINLVINQYAPSRNLVFTQSVWSDGLDLNPRLIGLLLVPRQCASCEGSTETPENWPEN
ncbi:MAG: DUF4249 domain-containing protein [Bacteroidetes bacterium]|nr:DUF4249 domain-containing protein [Bacteroidota bacterium]